MISIDVIEKEITELEARDTTYATIERLAWLYIVRDKLSGTVPQASVRMRSTSPFLQAVSGAPVEGVYTILDKLMSEIGVLYPTEYDNIIKQIKAL